MQVAAKLRYARISPQKCRLMADAIRGKNVDDALKTLSFTPKKSARIVKKVLESLKALRKNDEEKYLKFWGEFGPVLKEGLLIFDEKKDRILDLVLARSTNDDAKLASLDEYVERMGGGQEDIYYMVGNSIDALSNSPHLEAFKEKGIEVLLFADPVDEVWLQQMPPEFKGKAFKSAGRGAVDLEEKDEEGEESEKKEPENKIFNDLLSAHG